MDQGTKWRLQLHHPTQVHTRALAALLLAQIPANTPGRAAWDRGPCLGFHLDQSSHCSYCWNKAEEGRQLSLSLYNPFKKY